MHADSRRSPSLPRSAASKRRRGGARPRSVQKSLGLPVRWRGASLSPTCGERHIVPIKARLQQKQRTAGSDFGGGNDGTRWEPQLLQHSLRPDVFRELRDGDGPIRLRPFSIALLHAVLGGAALGRPRQMERGADFFCCKREGRGLAPGRAD